MVDDGCQINRFLRVVWSPKNPFFPFIVGEKFKSEVSFSHMFPKLLLFRRCCHRGLFFSANNKNGPYRFFQTFDFLPDEESIGTNAKLVDLQVTAGSLVDAGDYIAVLETEPRGHTYRVVAPVAGTVTEIKVPAGGSLRVGDPLFVMDHVPIKNTSSSENAHLNTQSIVAHMKSQSGKLQQEYMNELLRSNDLDRMLAVAHILRDKSWTTASSANEAQVIAADVVRIYQRIIELVLHQYNNVRQNQGYQNKDSDRHNPASSDLAHLYVEMALVYHKWEKLEEAISYYQKALEIPYGLNQDELIEAYSDMSVLLEDQGNLERAYRARMSVLEIQKTSFESMGAVENDSTMVDDTFREQQQQRRQNLQQCMALTENRIGLLLQRMGNYTEALERYDRALQMAKQVHPNEDHELVAGTYQNIAMTLTRCRNVEGAHQNIQKALNIRLRLHGEDHGDVSASRFVMASILSQGGRLEEAIREFDKVIQIQENHEDTIVSSSMSRFWRGFAYHQLERYDEALQDYKKALILRKSFTQLDRADAIDEDLHPDEAYIYDNIGHTLFAKGEYSKAKAYYQKAFVVLRSNEREINPRVAATLISIARTLTEENLLDDAMEYYRRSQKALTSFLDSHDPSLASVYHGMAEVLCRQDKFADAIEMYDDAIQCYENDEESDDLGTVHFNKALALRILGRKEEYKQALEAAVENFRRTLGDDHPNTITAQSELMIVA
jgi:tetratricopeptide (TPR) repeat protein